MSAIAAVSVPPIAVPHAASHEFARIAPDVARYLTPPVDDRCPLLEVPEEVMVKVFEKLGRGDMTTCRRVCKSLHDLLTNTPALALSHLLAASSLRINPHALLPVPNKPRLLPPSPAQLLEMLQKRLDRMSRFEPRKSSVIRLKEEEGRLYEYIEGILLRGTGGANGNRSLPQEMAVYDLRKLGEWEDEEDTDGEMTEEEAKAKKTEETRAAFAVKGDGQSSTNLDGTGEADGQDEEEVVDEEDLADTLRSTKKFGFEIAEFAVDPGQDLLVVVQIETLTPTSHNMFIHLKTLSTFEPHPRAPAEPLKWPAELPRRKVELGFQICDDGLYVLRHNQRIGSTDRLCGWQWTTGRLAVTLGASPVMSFESFVMLTPTSFIVPIVHTRLDTNSIRANVLTDPSDLSWTHHLHIYAFPPFSSTAPQTTSEPVPPPHTATLVRIVDMPSFHVDLLRDIPPPRMNIRCDPPPRETFPTHPVENVQPFIPEPTTGIYTIEFACQTPEMPFPHYVMIIPRQALLPHVPPRDSPVLRQARPRPATVVSWDRFRHHVRLFGHEMIPSAWVCYVYHNRYIAPIRRDRSNDPEDMEEDDRYDMDRMRLYDFDPLRVKRELLERTHADPAYISPLDLVRSARPSGDMQSTASTGSSHIDLLTGDLVTGSASNPTSPTSPSGAPSSPSKARSFIRRLSSTFKRSRLHSPEKQGEELSKPHKYDGEHKSITLITAETVLAPSVLLHIETRTGSKFPYTYVDKFEGITSETVLIDDERIVVVNDGDDGDEDWGNPRTKTILQVYEF